MPSLARKKKAILWLGSAFACAFVAFYALFVKSSNPMAAGGIAIIAFMGFLVCFDRGYKLYMSAPKDDELH